ncbi:probable serine hydrolase [Penaeus japonicus]|uniref:probable serine hydrolase n=1 Tax=Penaeus japonicus TaxID=27405 RepID=UPI001C711D7B|nr:probable serine hydrolase [Penaeus japonicus]XP_042893176.1 probable serine hydrolase [Penaeus japonicus]
MGEVAWRSVSVDVGWGTLRGKTCTVGGGDTPTLRLVGAHGWLDNANSFDALVPLLPAGVEVLVLDLPGHGMSDHLPLGAHYNPFTYAFNLRAAVTGLGWDRFVLMGHSMGAAVSNYFAALFPEFVEALINVDFLRPFHLMEPVDRWRVYAFDLFKYEQFESGGGTVYSEAEAIDRLVSARIIGNDEEVNVDHEAAQTLLPRSARRVEGGYVWSHDPKARSTFLTVFGGGNWVEALAEIRCPVLAVVATRGVCVMPDRVYAQVYETYRKNAAWFDREVVEGTHHVHLTHPERVAPAVVRFLAEVRARRRRPARARL